MKSKLDISHTPLQPIYNNLFGAKDFEFELKNIPSDKVEQRKKGSRETLFKNLGINPSDTTQVEELKAFIVEHTNMVELGKFLFGDNFKLNDPRKGIDKEAVFNQFDSLNKQYGYFKAPDKDSEEFKHYLACYAVCLYKAKVIEHNDNGNEVYDRAYKMLILFPKGKNSNLFTDIDKFVPQYASHLPNPIHDLFQHEMPKAGTYDLDKWRELIHKKGEYIIQNLANAPKVEEILGEAPKTVSELEEALSRISYPRAEENSELAKLCKHYKVPEDIFNRCLYLIKDGTIKIKSKDSIPSVIVDIGNEVDEGLKGYYLVKLPAGNLRGLILGKITNSCQSVGCPGEKFAIKGTVGEDTGFYLLLKSNNKNQKVDFSKFDWRDLERSFTISGQGNIWRGENGSMTIGCWENQNPTGHDIIAVKSLPVLADKIMEKDPSIQRFTLGLGGKTPKEFKDQYAQVQYDAPKDKFSDYDAFSQVVLKETEELIRVKEELVKRTGIREEGHILTAKQGQMILDLKEEILIKLIESEEYDSLTNVYIASYKKESEKFEESILEILSIKEKDEEKFKSLTSRSTIITYTTGTVSFQDLKDLDNEKIKLLTPWYATKAYETGKVSVTDLKDLDNEKIKLLTSRDATIAYETGKVSAADLKDLDNEKIKLLTSSNAIAAYITGKASAKDLKDLENEKIKLLTSEAAIEVYATDKVDFNVLKDDTTLGIKRNILKAIAEHICKENESFDYVLNIPESKYEILTSRYAIYAYKTEKVSVADLKDLDNKKITLLTSWEAIEAYQIGKASVTDLRDLDNEKIKLLTSRKVVDAYKTGKVSAADLKDLDKERIELLISKSAAEVYTTDKVDFNVLKDDTTLGIKRNILKAIAEHICKENESFDDILNIPESKYEILTSQKVVDAYKTEKVSVVDLKDLDNKKIELLTSWKAVEAYKTEKVSVADLKDLDNKKIELLTSWEVVNAYKTGKVRATDLKDLDIEKIELLTSERAIAAYKTGKASVTDLKDLDNERIKLLTSRVAIIAYVTRKASAKDLKDLDNEEIKWLTLQAATEAYKTNNDSTSHLSVKDMIKIKSLSKDIGENIFSSKAELHKEDIGKIQESLKEVINKIKAENPNFDTSKLGPGSIEWDILGYGGRNNGLTGIYYDASSYTTLGYITGEVHIPKVNLTEEVKDKLELYIKATTNQSIGSRSVGG